MNCCSNNFNPCNLPTPMKSWDYIMMRVGAFDLTLQQLATAILQLQDWQRRVDLYLASLPGSTWSTNQGSGSDDGSGSGMDSDGYLRLSAIATADVDADGFIVVDNIPVDAEGNIKIAEINVTTDGYITA